MNEYNERVLSAYQQAINDIDDYFEYGCQSTSDREYVHGVLAQLTNELNYIYGESQDVTG